MLRLLPRKPAKIAKTDVEISEDSSPRKVRSTTAKGAVIMKMVAATGSEKGACKLGKLYGPSRTDFVNTNVLKCSNLDKSSGYMLHPSNGPVQVAVETICTTLLSKSKEKFFGNWRCVEGEIMRREHEIKDATKRRSPSFMRSSKRKLRQERLPCGLPSAVYRFTRTNHYFSSSKILFSVSYLLANSGHSIRSCQLLDEIFKKRQMTAITWTRLFHHSRTQRRKIWAGDDQNFAIQRNVKPWNL